MHSWTFWVHGIALLSFAFFFTVCRLTAWSAVARHVLAAIDRVAGPWAPACLTIVSALFSLLPLAAPESLYNTVGLLALDLLGRGQLLLATLLQLSFMLIELGAAYIVSGTLWVLLLAARDVVRQRQAAKTPPVDILL